MSAVVRPRPFPQESECCMVVCISTGPYKTPVSGSSHRPEIWLVLRLGDSFDFHALVLHRDRVCS